MADSSEPSTAPPVPKSKGAAKIPVKDASTSADTGPTVAPVTNPMPKPTTPEDEVMKQPLELPDQPTAPSKTPKSPKSPRKFPKKLLLIVLILAALGYAGSKFMNNQDNQPAKPARQTQTPAASKEEDTDDVPATTTTEDYENGPLALSLKYPTTWTATDTNDRGVRIISPDFSYETSDGETVTGNFRIYIRKGAREQDSKYIGKGVAVQASEKLKYTSPEPGQRTETSVSFFGLDEPEAFAYFLIAGNFSLKKGDTLGPNYGKESDTYIISGGYSSKDLTDDMATNQVPLDYFAKTNAYKQALEIIKSLKLL